MIVAIIFIVVTSISGFFGKAALEKTGGSMIVLGIGFALASSSFSWLWVVAWLIGLFIGWAIVVVKEVAKEESGSSSEPYIYTSEGDGFTISYPNKPDFIHQNGTRLYRYVKGDIKYLVTVSNPDFTSIKDYQGVVEIERNPAKLEEVQRTELQNNLNFLPHMADEVVRSRNEDTFHGFPCADAEYISSGLYKFSLEFYVGERLFSIIVAHHQKEMAEPEFHRFVESFNFANS